MKRTITFLALLLMAGAAMAQGEFVCGDTVRDGSGNAYATVQIGALCWTKSNMRAVSYADGSPIAKAMIYNSERYNDTVANLANFGRLYTWWSAVNVPEGDDVKPAKDTAGFVQGVCPEGWHIPTVGEMNDLRSVPEEDLHSTDFWVLPNANTNSTGFSEVPGGKFSAELDRFEGLYTNSYMWTDSATSSEWVVACNSRYFCNKASEESVRKGDALSVRCVRVAEVCSEVATFNVDECDVTDTSVLVKGNAKVEKGTFTEYGFVWGVSEDALTTTVYGSGVSAMTSEGNFEATIKGLPVCGDTVWYAAYAKTSQCKELIYGDTMMFVVCGKAKDAQPCAFAPKVADNEGNEYNTVQIGNQCWMKENLRTKHWNDGTEIPLVDVRDDDLREPMMYQNPYNQELYYNWPAANNEKGICPEGWHIPSDVEFYELFDYVGSKSDYVCGAKTHNSYENISKALASTEGWNHSDSTCTPGNQPQNNNATGFSALPTGTPPVNSPFTDWSVGNYAAGYWSSIELTGSGTTEYYKNVSYYYLTMDHDEAHPRGWVAMKSVRASVRCLKDACGYVKDDCPIVITDTSFLRISSCDTSVVVNAELNNMHGVQTDWGFVWGKDKNSLTDTVNFANGDDVTSLDDQGRFEYGIKNIKQTDTIWYVAFAKSNKCDKVIYGDTLYWYLKDKVEDGKPCFGVPTVKDFNGYVYNTVQIGNQCWMKENLRSTKYADGTNIPLADRDTSTTKAYRYNPNNDGGNVKEYGYLYNWAAVMHGEGSSNSNPSKVQGICPDGWHVPSESEFRQLFEYVGSKSDYLCNGKADSIAKALCYPEGWDNSSTDCAVGNAPENNNLTGFSAKPAGTFGDGNSPGPGYWFFGRYAMFWTSTGVDTLSPDWQLDDISILSVWPPVAHRWGYGSKNISINAGSVKPSVLNSWKFYARSVRCVMDACDDCPQTDAIPCPGTPTVKDHENNVYNTVQIGDQCWTRENMRATTSPTGKTQFQAGTSNESRLTPIYYNNSASAVDITERGLLYNWAAALDTVFTATTDASFTNRRGICPEGWHVPSRAEWQTLIDYAGTVECYTCGGNANATAKALAFNNYWASSNGECHVGNDLSANNRTGFSVIPTGYGNLPITNDTTTARFWSSTGNNTTTSFGMMVNYNMANGSDNTGYDQKQGFAVRCLKDAQSTAENCPTVTTTAATEVAADSAKLNGVVTNVSGTVENYGFVWGTSKNTITTTVNGTSVTAMTADGDFSSILKGLNPCDTIWYAAFAKTSDCSETVYGDTLMFKVPAVAPDYTTCGTVIDIDDNRYTTVKIGNQCWMAENLRVTKYADGTPLTDKTSNSTNNIGFTEKVYFAPNGDANNITKYGMLYSWAAATNATNTTTSGTFQTWENYEGQGICPDGWHLPSDAEWDTLTNYVRDNYTTCLCDNTSIGKALASATDWKSGGAPTNASWSQQLAYNANWGECSIGWPETTGLNNITGFSAYPAGNWNYEENTNGFFKFGEEAMFWTSTLYGTTHQTYGYNNALKRTMYYYRKDIESNNYYQLNTARSVRCLKDADTTCAPVGDAKPCPGTPTVKDHQNNEYNTVQIGNQCWTRENMRATTSPTGKTQFQAGTSNESRLTPIYYNNSASAVDLTERGFLYNWAAALDTVFTATTDASFTNRRGICPEGWHVPSRAEWQTLIDYEATVECYTCGGNANATAKALAFNNYWASSNGECHVGNDLSTNNRTGFSVIPTGYGSLPITNDTTTARFWSSTGNNTTTSFGMMVNYNMANGSVNTGYDQKQGFAVRCVKDADADTTCAPVGDAKPCPGTPTVKDHENNVYNTVQIGDQCWTRENMRATTSPTGKTQFQAASGLSSYVDPQYYDYSTSLIPLNDRGLLYNWAAAMDTVFTSESEMNVSFANRRGICPEGWHVPTSNEWTVLENYVKSQDCYLCDNDNTYIAKALSSTKYWFEDDVVSCIVGNDLTKNNATGFSAVPAGMCRFPNYYLDSIQVSFWSSTSASEYGAYFRNIMSHERVVTREAGNDKNTGYSVRCLKDLTHLQVVIDEKSCPEAPTVTDHEGNVYATVKIGDQCWTRDNLRTTTSPSTGTYLIPASDTVTTFTGKQARWYNNDSTTYAPMNYGLLYNWNAAVDTFNTAYGETSVNTSRDSAVSVTFTGHRRGICPAGWHLPSDAEWTTMTDYVSSQSEYVCGEDITYIAKALADSVGWSTRTTTCAVGNNQSANNATGFSAVPAGDFIRNFNVASFYDAGDYASFWSSSQNEGGQYYAWRRGLRYYSADVYRYSYDYKVDGRSVRCLKDAHDTCNVSDGSPCPNAKTVTDIDGITYNTVKIGEQCWMKENMRAKHFADGQEIEFASSDDDSRPTCWFPNGDENNVEAYGLLYNRIAAMNGMSASYANPSGIQGVCPDGWHVPSYTEWYQLYNYVGSIPSALCSADTSKYIGKSLASKTGWLTVDEGVCNVGFNADGNNFTGFSAMPAGEQLSSASNFRYYSFGKESEIWSTTRELDYIGRGYYAGLVNNRPDDIMWRSIIGNQGLSVRCLKDDGCDCNTQTELPTVITSSHVSNINIVAADGGGFVSSQGSSSVTERGVCWSTSHNPTVTDNRTTDGNGAGRFTSYINNLTQGTTYYIRAYATNSSGTAYGREVEYTVPSVSSADGKPCPGTPIVFDHEGNKYNTVQIGTQCWTKENLRTTTSPSTGTYIVAKTGSILTTAGKMARWYNNDSVTYAPKNYGLLYNYNAAVDTFDVQFDETSTDTTIYKNIQFPKNSIRRGICPEGWHIPSVSEWGTLRVYTGYLRGNQENGYRCGIHDDGGAKALASTDDWLDYTDSDFPCAVGYHKEDNNSSGFSALPVGQCDDLSTGYNYIGTFRLIREHTSFWYLIEKNVTVNHYWLANDRGGFYAGGGMRSNELHPVRCLKDN